MATMKKYFSGRSLEQAVMAAASELDIPREELRYEEVDKRHGFVRTRRKVVISVDPDNPRLGGEEPQVEEPEATPDGPRRRRRRGSEERPRRARAERPSPEPSPEPEPPAPSYEEPEDVDEEEDEDDEPARRPSGATHRTPGWWHARPVQDEDDEDDEEVEDDDLDDDEFDEDEDEDDFEDSDDQDDEDVEDDDEDDEEEDDDDEEDDDRAVAVELPRRRRRRRRGGRGGGPGKEREEVTEPRREPPRREPPRREPERREPERAPGRGRRGAESGRDRRGGAGREERVTRRPEPAPAPVSRQDERGERGGGGRRQRPRAGAPEAGDRQSQGRGGGGRRSREARGGGGAAQQRSLGARQEAFGQPPQGGGDRPSAIPDRSRRLKRAEGEAAEATLDALELLLEFCGIEAQAEIYQGEGDRLEVELWGPDDRVLLADDGKVLLAMEHIIPRMIRTTLGDAMPIRVDCDNFHMIREERLRDLAQRVASEVVRSGNARTLDEMDPAERRIIHITLENDASVETESVGRGYYKRVRIRPL